jgi:putative FmdB family regulatory protein
MPIYEYLCPACNRIFNFLVKSTGAAKQATCPKCGGTDMKKLISSFAVTGVDRKSKTEAPAGADGDAGADPLEDPRVEREMMKLMSDAENIDENDPRQLGRLMRRMTEITGEPVEPEMEEAMRRLEAGEDPEKIEDELGDFLGDEGEDGMGGPGGGAPSYDDGLYEL